MRLLYRAKYSTLRSQKAWRRRLREQEWADVDSDEEPWYLVRAVEDEVVRRVVDQVDLDTLLSSLREYRETDPGEDLTPKLRELVKDTMWEELERAVKRVASAPILKKVRAIR